MRQKLSTLALSAVMVLVLFGFAVWYQGSQPAPVIASQPKPAIQNPVVRLVTQTEPLTFQLVHKNLRLDQVISPCGPRTFSSPDTHFHAFDLFACAVPIPARQRVEWLVTFPEGSRHCMISGKWAAIGGKHNDVRVSVDHYNVRSEHGELSLDLVPGQYRVTIDNSFEPFSEKMVGGEITASFEK